MSLLSSLMNVSRRRSAWVFHANAGSCNGCDIEFMTCLTPRYDMEQLGIRHEASPRHADIIVVSGPVTRTTCEALETVYGQIPDPKVVVALGSCPATCNVFAGSPTIVGPLDRILPVDVFVPGCPPRPDAIIAGIADAAAILAVEKPRPTPRPTPGARLGTTPGSGLPGAARTTGRRAR